MKILPVKNGTIQNENWRFESKWNLKNTITNTFMSTNVRLSEFVDEFALSAKRLLDWRWFESQQ